LDLLARELHFGGECVVIYMEKLGNSMMYGREILGAGLLWLALYAHPAIAQDEFGGFPGIKIAERVDYTNCELAELTLAKDDYIIAIELLRDCLAQDLPANERARYLNTRADTYLTIKFAASALADYEEVLELGLETSNVHVGRGEALNLLGRHEEAVDAFKKVMAEDPGNPRGPTGLGSAHYALEHPGLASAFLDMALEGSPDYVPALRTRGTIRFEQSEFSLAISDFTTILGISPEDSEAFYRRGLSKARLGEFAAAAEDLTQANRLDPEDDEVKIDRAIVLARIGQADEAQRELNETVDRAPNNARALMVRGRMYMALDMSDNAIQDFNQALAIEPNGDHVEEAMKLITLLSEEI
jgi:tetratricopeptide (TPR) repeat protein